MKRGTLLWRRNPFLDEGRPGRTAAEWAIDAAPHVLIKIKRVFPRANQERSGWIILADTPEVARDIEWVRGRYELDATPDVLERLRERADEHRAIEQAVGDILGGQRRLTDGRYLEVAPTREHRDYQYAAADLVLTTGHLLLVDELGLGKSMSSLLVLREPAALPALIVCLTHLPTQWANEVRETFPGLRVHIVQAMEPYDIARRRGSGGTPDVLIVPWSKLRGWGDHLVNQVATVIFDEAQELRKGDSQKWTAAARVADGADYVIGLTATPVYNYAGEIHTIYQVLAPGVLGTRSEFMREWKGRIVSGVGDDHIAVEDPGALGTYLRAEGLMLRRTRKEVGRELPDVIRVTHAIDSDRDTYERLEGEALDLAELIVGVAEPLPDGVVSLAAYRNRSWQARGEFDWRLRQATGIAKAPYVAEFVKMLLETDEQVVLYGWHRAVYDLWMPRLAASSPMLYTGTESPRQKDRARDAFIDGEARVLIMSLRAGAGLDGLQQAAHVAVFGELDWSPGMHEQCIGRLHRDGQGDHVVAYFLVSEHGTDPEMAQVLHLKRQQSEPILNPDQAGFELMPDHGDRIRRLAQNVLERRAKRAVQET